MDDICGSLYFIYVPSCFLLSLFQRGNVVGSPRGTIKRKEAFFSNPRQYFFILLFFIILFACVAGDI